jgi:hypothetical protein
MGKAKAEKVELPFILLKPLLPLPLTWTVKNFLRFLHEI